MTWRALLWASALAIAGCDGGPPPALDGAVAPTLDLGERCTDSAECLSGICVGIDEGVGVCSRLCGSAHDCPTGDNWSCVTTAERPELAVCGCQPDADEERCADGRDNDCDGRADDCLTCGGRLIAGDDDEHCGACFESCRADEECRGGECRCRDRAEVFCEGRCVDTAGDARHCGACGNECRSGDACIDGVCGCPPERAGRCADGCFDFASDPSHCGGCDTACEAGLECIDGACACPSDRPDPCATECVDTSTDGRHCGACGSECPAGTVCRSGSCECGASTDADWCDGVGCVDLATDPAHCGSCGNACTSGLVCRDGACACPTTAAPDHCPGIGCTSLDRDAASCGACGDACPTGLACRVGTCQCPDAGDVVCSGECVDTDWDARHCGGCGAACLPGERCVGGACTCPGGLICDGRCITPSTSNCGACGAACGPGQVCSGGSCACPSTLETFCGDGCYPLLSDETHCGGCTTTCGPGQTCLSGVCSCPSGQTWCDTVGACVNLSTDPTSCGACGNACRSGEVCRYGACGCSSSSQTYCDSAGGCVDTRYDEDHCGGCDAACADEETCSSGTCRCSLSSDRFCASTGACTDVRDNDDHCGSCDNACPVGASCSTYDCVCAVAGETACATGCTDLQSDGANCGACGTTCSATEECRRGMCACPTPTLGLEHRLTTTGFGADARIARGPTRLAVVYTDRAVFDEAANVHFQLLDVDGAPIGSPRALSSVAGHDQDTSDPDVVWTGSEWGVIWYEERDTSSTTTERRLLMVQRLAADGSPVAPAETTELRDATGSWYELHRLRVAHTPTLGLVMVARSWGGSSGWTPRFRVLGDGSAPWPELELVAGAGGVDSDVDVAVGSLGELGVVYEGDYEVVFQRFEPDGSRVAAPVVLQHYSSSDPHPRGREPALAHDGTRFVAAFLRHQRPGWSIDQSDVMVCYVDDCGSPTRVHREEGPVSSDEHLFELRMDVAGDIAVIGWKQVDGYRHDVRGLRVRLSPTGPSVMEPAMEYMPHPTTDGAAQEWDLALVDSSSAVIAWNDERWGGWDAFDRAIELGTCAP